MVISLRFWRTTPGDIFVVEARFCCYLLHFGHFSGLAKKGHFQKKCISPKRNAHFWGVKIGHVGTGSSKKCKIPKRNATFCCLMIFAKMDHFLKKCISPKRNAHFWDAQMGLVEVLLGILPAWPLFAPRRALSPNMIPRWPQGAPT